MTEVLGKVMLVEDDLDIALLAQIALEEFGGLQFVHHATGVAALDAVDDYAPDLIMLDYRMPGMNGAEVLKALRERPATRQIPIIFMTASLMPKHVARLRDLGALDVLAKPFDPLTLADQIKRIWEMRGQASSNPHQAGAAPADQ
jgi:CheY-like chemotaxis protein